MYYVLSYATVTPGLTTSYDNLRWVNVGVSGTIVRRCTTSQRSGTSYDDALVGLVMSKNLATIPGSVGHREITVRRRSYSCDGRGTSYDVVRRSCVPFEIS